MLADPTQLLRIARGAQWSLDAVDLRADAAAWPGLPAPDRSVIAGLVAGFCVAEAAVAEHLAPFRAAAEDPGAAALLALQEGDEERHAALFGRIAREVCAQAAAEARPEVHALFGRELPAAARRLADGDATLAEAMGLYHLVLEGLVFAVGQEALLELLRRVAVLPGTTWAVERVQRDERWHVGFGVRCLADLGGVTPPRDEVVALALRAWGPEVATPARVAHARRVHARRLREARGVPGEPARVSAGARPGSGRA